MDYDDYTDKDIFLFLMTCSKRALGNFLLSRYDKNQQLTKDLLLRIEELLSQVGKVRAEIQLANLIRDHGEEIISRLLSEKSDEPQIAPHKAPTALSRAAGKS